MDFPDKGGSQNTVFEAGGGVSFNCKVDATEWTWWTEHVQAGSALTPKKFAQDLMGPGTHGTTASFEKFSGRDRIAALRIYRPNMNPEEYKLSDGYKTDVRVLEIAGRGFADDRIFVAPDAQTQGRLFKILPAILDAAKDMRIDYLKTEADSLGRYAWVKVGFLPSPEWWAGAMKQDALKFVRLHEKSLGADLAEELSRRIEAGGPEAIRFIASIEAPVPSCKLYIDVDGKHAETPSEVYMYHKGPGRFAEEPTAAVHRVYGKPANVPFGKAFFLEGHSLWHGRLDPADETAVKLMREAALTPVGDAPEITKPSDPHEELRYWGRLAGNPTLAIGASGPAWTDVARSAWLKSGGTDETFDRYVKPVTSGVDHSEPEEPPAFGP